MVQALTLAAESGSPVDAARLSQCLRTGHSQDGGRVSDDAVLTLAMLRRRIDALRNLLRTLPRHGLRLLRRAERPHRSRDCGARVVIPMPLPSHHDAWLGTDRIERPPDKTA